jgi:hypothetical protein
MLRLKTITLNCFTLFIFLPFFLQAQVSHYNLSWNTKSNNFKVADKVYNIPSFENAIHTPYSNNIPLFSTEISLSSYGEMEVTLINTHYTVIEDSTSLPLLADDFELKSCVVTERKKHFAQISLIPLRKQGSQIHKLTSFDLEVKTKSRHNQRQSRSYAANSVLSKGKWIKVAVASEGIYKLDFLFIKDRLQADMENTPFDKIGVFGNGGGMVPERNSDFRYDDLQENAIVRVDNNNNNRMDQGDYILFYGQSPDSWAFNEIDKAFAHRKNIYSDKTYYFITSDQASGKKILSVPSTPNPTNVLTTFDDYAFHEIEEFNLLSSGRTWLGNKMTSLRPTTNVAINFPNIIASQPVRYTSAVGASSYYPSTILLDINGAPITNHSTMAIPEQSYKAAYFPSNKSGTYSAGGDVQSIIYSFDNPDQSATSAGYIDFIELHAKRALNMIGVAMFFRDGEHTGSGVVNQYNLSNASSNLQIWDVTDPTMVFQLQHTQSGNTLSFSASASTLRQYAAVDFSATFSVPEYIENVANQDLHALDYADLIIVTNNDLFSQASDLAAFHNSRGLKTVVADKFKIYNEFGSGKADISAIRDFVKMFYDRAGTDSTKLPKYLTLFGDGSFDYKDRVKDNNNIVPTYQSYQSVYPLSSYTSDDFFGCLDDNEGGDMNSIQRGDIAIGRLPVINQTEATEVVDKIKRYKSNLALGLWRNIITTIGDDGEDNNGTIHQDQADFSGEYVRKFHPGYNVEKIILDAFQQQKTPAGDRYPDVNKAILNRINEGTLAISYTGHGGVNNWAHERIFNISDILNLKNKYRLPLFVTATCEFSRFDDPEKKTAGEFLITNPDGGAIALITTVRAVYSDANDALQNALFSKLFQSIDGRKPTLGELMTRTKNSIMGATDIENTRKFVLLGDAALSLNYPEFNVVTTHINSEPVSSAVDTFKALSKMTIKGRIEDWDGTPINSFNGVCYPMVYDKLSKFKTLGNDLNVRVKDYNIYSNILFKGASSITNGDFEFSFIVPKDINYNIGEGRISYYAESDANFDAHGYQNDIIIGGSADSFAIDNNGPNVKLYMNNDQFRFGGLTDENPSLYAVLEDESGINTTGNGLGHDISAILDEDSPNPIILNSFYQAELNSYQKGTITYPFSKLSEGPHTLSIKAWDIHNNSAEDNTMFVVAANPKLALINVLNYPNPVFDHTCFSFELNRANVPLQLSVKIFDQIGALVKEISGPFQSDGYRVECLDWDGLDNMGRALSKGVYIYKVAVSDEFGNAAHQSQRLVLIK